MFRLGARRSLANERLFALGFGPLEVMNIGRGPDPLHDPSLLVADRTPARQVPAVLAVLAAKAELGLKRLPCLAGLPQPAPRDFTVVGVNRLYPLGSEGLLNRNAHVLDPPLIAIIRQPVRAASVNDLGHGVGELAQARLALDNRLFSMLPRSDVVMRDDGPAALATQRRYRHQKPALLAWRVAGIFSCKIGARAVQHRPNAVQRRLYLAITLRPSAAAYVQIIDSHAVGNGRAVVFSRETSPVFVDGDDVSVPVEHGDVGRKRVEYGLVERLAFAQRRLCAFALSDVGGDSANGVRPPARVPERKLAHDRVTRLARDNSLLFEQNRLVGRDYFPIIGEKDVRDFLRVTVVIGFALQLHVRQAEQFRVPAVDSQVTALEVLDEDQGDGVFEDGAQLRLAILQRLLDLFALSDVGGDAANGVWPSALVRERKFDRNEVANPVGECDLLFKLKRRVGRKYFLIVGAYGVGDIFGVQIIIGFALHLGLSYAAQNFILAIDPEVVALEVFDEDDRGGMVQDGSQLRLFRPQRFFRALALRDVLNAGDRVQWTPLGLG